MKILCVFVGIFLAVSGFRIAPSPNSEQPKLVECGGWYGYFDVVYPSITGPRTIVTSSNFGKGDYANNEKCSVQFITGVQPINFRLNFTDFEVEDGYSCSWDSVCVSGFEFCGTSLDGKVLSYYVPANSTFTFSFSSDGTITSSGFRVVVDAVRVDSEKADVYYEDRCLTQYDEKTPTPIIDPYFPENTDYPDNGYDTDEFGNGNFGYIDHSSADSDSRNYNDYSTGDYDYGNNYNDYSTGDYDNSNNYTDYNTGDYDNSNNYNDYNTGDYDNSNNYNDYSTGDYDYGNNYNDYNTGDFDYGNNYNDYTTRDSSDVDYNYDSLYDYDNSIEDYTDDSSSEAKPVYEEAYAQPE